MIRPATFALRGTRMAPLVYLFQFRGTDLTGATIAAQVRQRADAPGDPEFALALGGDGTATGLRLIGVATVGGVTVSTVELVVSESDMASVPVNVETLGEPLIWAWDLQVTPAGGVKARWIEGAFEVGGGVTRTATASGAGSTGVDAILTLADEVVQIEVQGEALYAASLNAIEGLRNEAAAAADSAEASAGTALAASGITYASKAAGVAAVAIGQTFAVNNGDGTVTIYLKDGATNPEQRELPTPAWVDGQLAPLKGQDVGTAPTGSSQQLIVDRAFTGAVDGSSTVYGGVERLEAKGSYNIAQARISYRGLDNNSTGTMLVATGEHLYVWNKGAGNITYVRAMETHVRNDGPGTITEAFNYNTVGVTATGSITTLIGYNVGTIGDPNVTNAYGFNVTDQPSPVSEAIGYRSLMTASAGKRWAAKFIGDAPVAIKGKVMLGDTVEAAAALHVKDNRADFAQRIENAHASTPWGLRIYFVGAAPNNTTQMFIRCEDSTNNRFAVYSNGNVVNFNNSYGAISDRTLKRGITDARSQIEDIRRLQFRNYRLKADGKNGPEHLGVIAQEVAEVSPGLVASNGDHLMVNYSLLYLKAAKALQEAIAIIDDLAARVTALESTKEKKTMAYEPDPDPVEPPTIPTPPDESGGTIPPTPPQRD